MTKKNIYEEIAGTPVEKIIRDMKRCMVGHDEQDIATALFVMSGEVGCMFALSKQEYLATLYEFASDAYDGFNKDTGLGKNNEQSIC
jgi:hypothetical protein